MASERQIAANRRNAKKSTGPRSDAGRAQSRRNALRHGLAIAIGSDPALRADAENLARAISSEPDNIEFARDAAEAQLELLRIRQMRAELFNQQYASDSTAVDGQADLDDQLLKLDRYERRAFSRRTRAFRLIRSE
jgi:hypothetical protein